MEHVENGGPDWRTTDVSVSARDWESAYPHYRRLLFRALSRLASRGFTASPDEGLDLIHDFFLEAWVGVVERYDSERASFETYLTASFLMFARPRIVRVHRWRASLMSPSELASMQSDVSRIEASQALSADLDRIRLVVGRLPESQRALITTYTRDMISERDLARAYSMSRYELRQRLIDALGTVAISLGEVGALPEHDQSIAVALWRDRRTAREAAAVLRISTSEVQRAKHRLFERLVQAVKGERRMSSRSAQSSGNQLVKDLLRSFLSPDSTGADLYAIHQHEAAIITFLEDAEAEAFFSEFGADLDQDQLALLYSALGDAGPNSPPDELTMSLWEQNDLEEAKIGNAFAQVLIPNLPDALKQFADRMFLGAPLVPPDHLTELASEESVLRGGSHAAELVRFGVTPVLIAEITQSLANLARRFCRSHGIEVNQSFLLGRAGVVAHQSPLPVLERQTAVKEIVLVAELPEVTAERVYDWLTEVAAYAPNLFEGFKAERCGDELHLRQSDIRLVDIAQQWWPGNSATKAA